MPQMHECAFDMIDLERAAHATLLPPGTEHEMFDDQLAAPVEEIAERRLAIRRVEDRRLFDLDPRQLAALPAQLNAQPSKIPLLAQVLLARGEPFVLRYDSVVRHVPSPLRCVASIRPSPGIRRDGPK